MEKVNHYVAWNEPFNGCIWAYCQGYAESEQEFRQLCLNANIDLESREVECVKVNVRDRRGKPMKKGVEYDSYV